MGRSQKLKQQRKLLREREAVNKKENKKGILIVALVIILIAVLGFEISQLSRNGKEASETTTPKIETDINKEEKVELDLSGIKKEAEENKIAIIETEKGNIILELFTGVAPKTVENFVKLSNENFYDGIKFHRVISDFMIQGGDPLSKDSDPSNDGTGGPGYQFEDEINPWSLGLSEEEIEYLENQGYQYTRDLQSREVTVGALAMANSGPNTNGSQFFIVTEKDQPHLNGRHTVFGKVVEGMETVLNIKQGDIMKKVYVIETEK